MGLNDDFGEDDEIQIKDIKSHSFVQRSLFLLLNRFLRNIINTINTMIIMNVMTAACNLGSSGDLFLEACTRVMLLCVRCCLSYMFFLKYFRGQICAAASPQIKTRTKPR